MGRISMVMFDLAVTTVVDENNVAECLYRAALDVGLMATQEEISRSIGTNKIDLYKWLIARSRDTRIELSQIGTVTVSSDDARLAERAFRVYEQFMLDHYRANLREISGAANTFRWLHDRGIKVATDTGFHKNINDFVMEKTGWLRDGLVDIALDVEDVPSHRGRPAPYMIFRAMEALGITSVHEVIKCGDQPADLLEGYNAGCRGIVAVLSGHLGAEALGIHRHTHMIPSLADLPALIEREFLR